MLRLCQQFRHFWLEDARPSGFLGRLIAKRLPEYGYPENVAHWSNDDTLHYWATLGVDLIGDIIVGSHAFQLWSKQKSSSHSREIARYEKHAIEVLALGAAGSSAGGEQPKFLITVEDTPALVKFSPPVTTEIGRRRAELLVCEHLALKTLARHNISAAEPSIHFGENRVFLELRRFDRTEQGGRKSILSLRALDNEYTGRFPGTWKEIGYALREKQKLSREIYTSMLTLHYFGLLIGNDDMHSGNLSFLCDTPKIPDLPTSVAPVYDMLPMCAAPVNESVLPLKAEFPVLDPQDQQIYSGVATIAQEFWREVEAHDWLSREWKPFAVSWVRFIESVVSRR